MGNSTHSHGPGASHQPPPQPPTIRKCTFPPLVRTAHYYYSESFDTCDGDEEEARHWKQADVAVALGRESERAGCLRLLF